MYAIVDIAGKQFKVSKGESIRVPKVAGQVGKNIEFDKVLLISDKGKVTVGQPVVERASVKARIESFGRDRKVIVFKKKRRKGYQVTRGHRQDFTELVIKSISKAKAKQAGEQEDGA
ncbi:MAG: 50S ribosomal protein L21 [bacterium]